jgi:hypothetical protein
MTDLLLVRFDWPANDAVLLPRDARSGTPIVIARSVEGNLGYAWLEVRARADTTAAALAGGLGAAAPRRLTCLRRIDGAAAGGPAPFRYVVETDVEPDHEADFNAWYDEEHLAGLAGVPGTVSAARYRDAQGSPRYHACYDLEHLDVLGCPAWLAVRATPWSDRVRPRFVNTRRTMFRVRA